MALSLAQFRLVAARRLTTLGVDLTAPVSPEARRVWLDAIKGYASPQLREALERAFGMQTAAALHADDIMAIVDLAIDARRPLPESAHGGHHKAVDQ